MIRLLLRISLINPSFHLQGINGTGFWSSRVNPTGPKYQGEKYPSITFIAKTPLDTETQLVKHIPRELLPIAHHWLILHGRYVCTARKPKCEKCGITDYCKYYKSLG